MPAPSRPGGRLRRRGAQFRVRCSPPGAKLTALLLLALLVLLVSLASLVRALG
ncbi:hypothetical protein [Halorubrum coriense]|uniref:hypothetical protein n=1 Tax=Halorubrum coriense TaxID=64713 RepID=UPI001377F341|nr:hypothetical protein [Halorubrum coriense]